MRGNELLDKMELVDAAYVEAADAEPMNVKPKKNRAVWMKWGAADFAGRDPAGIQEYQYNGKRTGHRMAMGIQNDFRAVYHPRPEWGGVLCGKSH